MNNLAAAYADTGMRGKALPLFEETLKLEKAKFAPGHPGTVGTMNSLCITYAAAGEMVKAVALLAELRKWYPKDSPQLATPLAMIGTALLEQKKWPEAELLLRECQAIREKTQPEAWTTLNTKSALGGSLLGQKKYAEAEPLLLAGYEGMKQREKTIPPVGQVRLPEALDRLIEFYTATNKPEEVKKWQSERAKYPPAKGEVAPMPREKK